MGRRQLSTQVRQAQENRWRAGLKFGSKQLPQSILKKTADGGEKLNDGYEFFAKCANEESIKPLGDASQEHPTIILDDLATHDHIELRELVDLGLPMEIGVCHEGVE